MRTRRLLGIGAAFMCACALALAMSVTAFAADSLKVTGINNNEPNGTATKILTVQNGQGETQLYVDVYQGDTIKAKRLPVTAETTGVVSIDLGAENTVGLKLDVFNSESKSAPSLYTGTVYAVNAKLGDSGTKLIGTRTTTATEWTEAEMRNFVPQGSITEGGVHYALDLDADGNPVIVTDAKGNLCYSYSSYSPEETATGTISFVDQDTGKELDRRTYAGIKSGQDVKVSIPATVSNKNDEGDHNVYRTLFTSGGFVVFNNPNSLSYVIQCKVTGSEFDPTFHIVSVNFVVSEPESQAGKILATDKVSVSGDYKYTVPSTIEQYDSVTKVYTQYVLVDSEVGPSGVIDLNKETVPPNTFNIKYKALDHDREFVDVTYNAIDATKRVGEPGRVLEDQKQTVRVSASSPTAQPKDSVTSAEGKKLVLAGDVSQYTYNYKDGGATIINAYYVPEDYTPPAPYNVTVNYVNLANNTVIDSATYTASDTNADLIMNVPATFANGGENYVRLDGQGDTIRHNFFSGAATYTVYYRNVNDNLTKNVVITRINVVYDTVTGTATTAGTTGAALPGGTELTAVNPAEGGGVVTTPGGTDAQTVREIGDNQNPLAAGNNAQNQGFSIEKDWPLIAGGICLILAIAIIAAVVASRRKKQADGAASGGGTN